MTALEVFSVFSAAGIGAALIVLGRLSKRFGAATKATPRYIGFYAAAGYLLVSAALQLLNAVFHLAEAGAVLDSSVWFMVYTLMPAVGITIGLVYAWHYWSWLLAESG